MSAPEAGCHVSWPFGHLYDRPAYRLGNLCRAHLVQFFKSASARAGGQEYVLRHETATDLNFSHWQLKAQSL